MESNQQIDKLKNETFQVTRESLEQHHRYND